MAKVQGPRTQADRLRQVFNTKYNAAELQSQGIYDQRDVENVASNDLYVSQFIRESETIQDAADRLHEALKFRCEFKVRDITEESLPREAWEAGGIFYHNIDKDGRRILWFKVKLHKKDPARLVHVKRFIMYHFESTYNESPEEQIVVLFDMSGAGISNLDLEMIKFVITSFKIYYPKLLGYMLIYEMPWLFNAAWKVIKTWLSPEAVKKIKFVNKSDVQEYIDKDQLPEHMGGTDQYKYVYIPPEERDPIEDLEGEKLSTKKKQVTFADQSMNMYRSFNGETKEDMNNSADNQSPSTKTTSKPQIHRRETSDENTFVGRLLTICPADELVFTSDEQGKDSFNTISLKNTLPYQIAFKVKTTSPEKYKVRPSSGIVKPGSTARVYVQIHQGYQSSSVDKDKFLIMAMEMTGDAPDNLTDLWKSVQRENVMEHRLQCTSGSKKISPNTASENTNIIQQASQDQISVMSKKPLLSKHCMEFHQTLHKQELKVFYQDCVFGPDPLMKMIDALVESNQRLQHTVYLVMLVQIMLFIIICALLFYSYINPSVPVNSTVHSFCGSGLF